MLSTQQPTVADLCAIVGLEPVAEVSPAMMSAPVVATVELPVAAVLASGHDAGAAPLPVTRAAVLLDETDVREHRGREYVVDLALRLCAQGEASVLVVVGDLQLSRATVLLSELLRVPLLRVPALRSAATLAELISLVRRPDLDVGHALASAARALDADDLDLSKTLGAVAEVIRGLVVVQSGSRLIQAERSRGSDSDSVPLLFQAIPVRGSEVAYTTILNGRGTAVCAVPVPRALHDHPLLLVAQNRNGGGAWRERALQILLVARHRVAALIAERHLLDERRRSMSSILLQELLDASGTMRPSLAGRAEDEGWCLDGWHLAVHFRRGSAPLSPATMDAVDGSLGELGLGFGGLVPGPPGAVAWLTVDRLDVLPGPDELLEPLSEALEGADPGGELVAGVGSTGRGPKGLVQSLRDAQQASLRPLPSGPARVLSGPGSAVERVLVLWQHDEVLKQEARDLVALLDTDAVLRDTLIAYFRCRQSVSQTARSIGAHRNTVAQRLTRAESLLGTSFSDPETALVVGAALRIATR